MTQSTGLKTDKPSALQQHVSFWDRKKRGVIYPTDSYAGFRALGFNAFISVMSAAAFHVLHVGYPTQKSWIPNLLFPVDVSRIARAKHGSDTGSYDQEGHFTESKFNRIFDRFDHGKKGGLYFSEITDFWAANRCVLDVVGWVFQVFLWTYLWLLAADPKTGILSRDVVRAQYDGSLYYQLEARQKRGDRLPFLRGGELW